MSDVRTLIAEVKQGTGKARAIRRGSRVPAIVYGNKIDPAMVSVSPIDLMKGLRDASFFSTLCT